MPLLYLPPSSLLKDVETASIQMSFNYDSEDWKLTVEVIKADIIPADEDKEKEGNFNTHRSDC